MESLILCKQTSIKLRKQFFIFLLFIATNPIFSQIGIGQWRDHLPYNKGISVVEAGSRIYCATPYSLFYYEKADNSIEKLSKVNGLSDIGISKIGYDQTSSTLIVAYKNTNIDLIKDKRIINISDIKRKQILGNKTIHNIFVHEGLVYLSCGFGIVVLDFIREEIKDTYYIGPNGTYLNIFDLAASDENFYAATESGVYVASVNALNLADFASWQRISAIPEFTSGFNLVEVFKGKVIVNKPNTGYNDDILYVKDGVNWQVFAYEDQSDIHDIVATENRLMFCRNMDILVYNQQMTLDKKIWSPNQQSIFPRSALIDVENQIWIADEKNALVKTSADGWQGEFIGLNGPGHTDVFSMKTLGNDLWVASGGRSSVWAPLFKREGISSFINERWTTINCTSSDCEFSELENVQDMLSIAINPFDQKQVFAGTWQTGLLEFNEGFLTETFTNENSTLGTWNADPSRILVSDLAFDEEGNLWVANSGANDILSVKTMDGNWYSFNLGSSNSGIDIGNMLIDSYNQKWIIPRRSNSLLVFNDKNTITSNADDEYKVLNSNIGNGAIFAAEIVCITEDLNNEIWLGTNEGIGVIYTPENIFNGGNYDVRRIKVEWDNYVQYLLETERVTSIAVDGANRKWVGTENSGVFLLSEDGTEQIFHFTAENSPLLANHILAMAINVDGEVFFGTENGIISHRSEAAEARTENDKIYVFPNPVRENYEAPITIKNVPFEASIKITDISGDLIFETRSLGGQAIWDGKTFNGQKPKTGIYLVFVSNRDGSSTSVAKIMFIN